MVYFNDFELYIRYKEYLKWHIDKEVLTSVRAVLIHDKINKNSKSKLINYFTRGEQLSSVRWFWDIVSTESAVGTGIYDSSVMSAHMMVIFYSKQ